MNDSQPKTKLDLILIDVAWIVVPIIMFAKSNNQIALIVLSFALSAVIFGRLKTIKQDQTHWYYKIEKLSSFAMFGAYVVWLTLSISETVT